jgi:very-short-patch-repair endonuclease
MLENGLYDGFSSEEIFHGFVVDEINHGLKIIVEMFGDLYHCNPRKYKDSSLYINVIQRTVEEQWLRDRRRFACFNSHGYTTIVIWEYDFRRNSKTQIERIKNEIDQKRKNQ